MGSEEKEAGKHEEHVYDAADQHVTFPYHLPYFKDYKIVQMYYTAQDEETGTEEMLKVSYNADIFVTTEMEEAMRKNSKEIKKTEGDTEYSIYGPYYEEDDIILPIHIIMKRSPFEIVSPDKERMELDKIEIAGKEIVYDYVENIMTSRGNNSYYIFEVEEDGVYYRVYVEVTSKLSKDDVEKQIKEMSSAILLWRFSSCKWTLLILGNNETKLIWYI